ncbi:hypothetical protein S40285_03926 [Stachybotrys chlorohalonatus IBT 40285]|uniref:Shikimate dehydrogenase substrate binding N-terminal domain-containing protein n=1 Tax=Stachybotrys chlorohalonatus (strain IBT 40285) TaxID=1283841 RepID=A0A084R157_STAC4|nr:hypothetical protein S40285_03926 [Stachybotrys chlorohalonata IBT 40285]
MALSPSSLPDASLASQTAQFDRHGYLFGQHITHSLSPLLHDVVYQSLGLRWGQVRLDSADVPHFLQLAQHPSFYGASVTMPNKVAIIPHLDHLTPECRAVGACNTLFLRTCPTTSRRLLCGANTDVVGIRDSFLRNDAIPESTYRARPALVIGGGGAARSAIYALREHLSVADIYLVNRDPDEVAAVRQHCDAAGYGGASLVHVSSVEQAHALPAPGAIVACVPDFEPATPGEILARDITDAFLSKGEQKGAMLEMCYNPTPFTRLGALAEGKGWQVILGTEAMLWQGLEQDRYWTGRTIDEMPVKQVKEAIEGVVKQRARQNRL